MEQKNTIADNDVTVAISLQLLLLVNLIEKTRAFLHHAHFLEAILI
jgi:hypothetical protein